MPLFLIACVCDEGVYETSFRVVEAPSRLDVSRSIIRNPYRWSTYLERSHFWEEVRDHRWSENELLKRIDASSVDGDSRYRLSIYEITEVEVLDSLTT
jgi:hypothetical protein